MNKNIVTEKNLLQNVYEKCKNGEIPEFDLHLKNSFVQVFMSDVGKMALLFGDNNDGVFTSTPIVNLNIDNVPVGQYFFRSFYEKVKDFKKQLEKVNLSHKKYLLKPIPVDFKSFEQRLFSVVKNYKNSLVFSIKSLKLEKKIIASSGLQTTPFTHFNYNKKMRHLLYMLNLYKDVINSLKNKDDKYIEIILKHPRMFEINMKHSNIFLMYEFDNSINIDKILYEFSDRFIVRSIRKNDNIEIFKHKIENYETIALKMLKLKHFKVEVEPIANVLSFESSSFEEFDMLPQKQ